MRNDNMIKNKRLFDKNGSLSAVNDKTKYTQHNHPVPVDKSLNQVKRLWCCCSVAGTSWEDRKAADN